MTEALVDSSYLYALLSTRDRMHMQALEFSEITSVNAIVPDVILADVAFLFHREGGVPAVTRFMRNFAITETEPLPLRLADIYRAQEIMSAYATADFDFVDCAIMARAERLNIRQVLTFDRRDFSIVRPAHCEYFELLP